MDGKPGLQPVIRVGRCACFETIGLVVNDMNTKANPISIPISISIEPEPIHSRAGAEEAGHPIPPLRDPSSPTL